jgi:hypothetical protein
LQRLSIDNERWIDRSINGPGTKDVLDHSSSQPHRAGEQGNTRTSAAHSGMRCHAGGMHGMPLLHVIDSVLGEGSAARTG